MFHFSMVVAFLSVFSASCDVNSMLSSSGNGQVSFLIHQCTRENEAFKYSLNFGKTWDVFSGKSSICENGHWTSLLLSSSGKTMMATRNCLQIDGPNEHSQHSEFYSIMISSLEHRTLRHNSFKNRSSTIIKSSISALSSSENAEIMFVYSTSKIYMSSDYGESWKVSLDLGSNEMEVMIKTSDNAQYTFALIHEPTTVKNDLDDGMGYSYSSVLYMSADFGNSWDVVVQSLTTSKGVNSLWVSNDGQYVMCSSGTNMVLYSRDYSRSFVNMLPRSNAAFSNSACTAGTDDADENISKHSILNGILSIIAVTMSHNAHYIVLAAKSVTLKNMLLISCDGGHSWSKQPAPTSDLRHITVDNEGERIIGVLQDGTITTITLLGSKTVLPKAHLRSRLSKSVTAAATTTAAANTFTTETQSPTTHPMRMSTHVASHRPTNLPLNSSNASQATSPPLLQAMFKAIQIVNGISLHQWISSIDETNTAFEYSIASCIPGLLPFAVRVATLAAVNSTVPPKRLKLLNGHELSELDYAAVSVNYTVTFEFASVDNSMDLSAYNMIISNLTTAVATGVFIKFLYTFADEFDCPSLLNADSNSVTVFAPTAIETDTTPSQLPTGGATEDSTS